MNRKRVDPYKLQSIKYSGWFYEEESKYSLYTRKLQYEHFTQAFWLYNNLCEFMALEHKSNSDFVLKNWF